MSTTTPTGMDQAENRARLAKTVAYYITFVALGLAAVTLGPTLQGLATHTGASLSQISLVFSARALGYMFGSYTGGRLYDRMPGHPLVAAMLFLMAVTLVLTPLVSVLWLLVAVLLILGAAEGAIDVGGNTLLVWVHGRQVGPFMNGLHFCWGLGAFLSPIIIARAVLASGDITLAYWMLAILVLPPIIGLLRLPSPTAHREVARKAAAPANLRLLSLIVAFFYLCVGAEGTFGGWIYTYAVALGQTNLVTSAYLTAVFWGALTLGRLLGMPVASRVELRAILFVDVLGCLASVALILAFPASTAAIWAGAFGMGLFMASMFPTMISYAEQRMAITGQVTAWFLVGSAAAGMTVPWLVGQLFERIGPRITMVVVFVDLLLCLIVFAAIAASSTRVSLKQAELQPEADVDLG